MTTTKQTRYAANNVANMAARHQKGSPAGQAAFLLSVAKLCEADAKRLELQQLEAEGAGRE